MKRYFLILFLLIPFSALSQKSLLTAPYSYRLVAHAFSKESRFGNQWSVIIGAGGMVKINDVFFIGAEYDYIIPMIEVPSPQCGIEIFTWRILWRRYWYYSPWK